MLSHSNLEIEETNEEIVYFLMERDKNRWDVDKIKTLFNPRMAVEILKLPFSSMHRVDWLVWTEERSRKFSVKSAYRLIVA